MRVLLCAAVVAAALSFPSAAQEKLAPVLKTTVNAIWFDNWVGLSDAMLRVATPGGEIQTVHERTRAPRYTLSGAPIVDGRYEFELHAATDKRVPIRAPLPALDDEEVSDTEPVMFYMSGAFLVKNGAVVGVDGDEEEDDG